MISQLLYKRSLGYCSDPDNSKRCTKARLKEFSISNIDFIKRMGLQKAYECHDGCINAIQFNETGDRIISGSDDMCICISDLVKGETILTHKTQHTSNIFQAKHVPCSNEIVSCARDGSVRLYQITSTVTEQEIAKHTGSTHKLCVYNRNEVLSAGEDGCVLQTDIRTRHKEEPIVEQDDSLYSIDTDHGNYIVLSGVSRDTWLYDLRKPSSPALIYRPLDDEREGECDGVETATCSKFNYNGTSLITSYNNSAVYLYNTHDNTAFEGKYTGHRNSDTVKGVNFYGINSEYVISGSDCGHIFFWDTKTQKIVQCLEGEQDGIVNCLEYNTSRPMLASSGLQHSLKIWEPILEEANQMSDLDEIIEKNESGPQIPRDIMTIFLTRGLNDGGDLRHNCQQS